MSRGPYPIMLVLAMSLPGAVRALGLGDIRIDSALNEPLSAQIDIVGATREELIALTAKVANREVFQRHGADRPSFLASATFKVGMDSQGRPVLNVRSADPFTDPVVNFLVDLRWNNGELIREYSLLLDPAGFNATRRLADASAPAASGAQPAAVVAAPRRDPQVAAMMQQPPRPAFHSSGERMPVQDEPSAPAAAVTASPAAAQHRVAAKDTLRGIVRRAGVRSEGQAQRMMIAIFRANPHAFDGNINLLHLGAVLTLPTEDQVASIDPAEARREVRSHMTAWRMDGRPAQRQFAAASTTAPLPSLSQGAAAAQGAVAAPDAVGADALRGRVRSLEQALDDMHRQLASESATLQDLKQLAVRANPAPAAAPTTVAAATPSPNVAPAPVAVAAVAAEPATAVERAAQPSLPAHAQVNVEVMHASAPQAAVVAPPPAPRMSLSLLGPISFGVALLAAGVAYGRRRMMKAFEPPSLAPLGGTPPDEAPSVEAPVPAPVPVAPQSARPESAPPRAVEPAKAAPVRVEPRAPAAAPAASVDVHVSTDQTTQELAIDTEALERSYLDALAVDTLGIDTSDIAKRAETHEMQEVTGSHASDITASHDTAGLDTVAIDASELESAIDKADLHTAIMDMKKMEPVAVNTALDYNLLDLDATAEHIQAQHVQMPSGLHDHVVVSERRMNIVEVLKSAIDRDPARRDLRMKLLETYYSAASVNRRAFLEVVKKLSREREFLSAEDWNQVVKMGREIAPDDILFADDSKDLADCA